MKVVSIKGKYYYTFDEKIYYAEGDPYVKELEEFTNLLEDDEIFLFEVSVVPRITLAKRLNGKRLVSFSSTNISEHVEDFIRRAREKISRGEANGRPHV